jgi:hypothetical protein
MNWTFAYVGIACIVGAIVGGGLKMFNVEIPALASLRRQGMLAGFGCILILVNLFQRPAKPEQLGPEQELLEVKNNDGVLNGPSVAAEFVIEKPFHITDIWDYHYNWGEGTTPGNIGLRRSDGKMFGPWEVTAATTQEKRDWVCKPNTTIPPGTYTVVVSDPQSWSWNSKTDGRGMTKVKGKPVM